MQSYTFGSDEGMAAVLAAFDATGDDTYAVTLNSDDTAALVSAVDAYVLSTADDWSRAHAAHVRSKARGRTRYEAQWTRATLSAVIYALRRYALGTTEDLTYAGGDHPVNRAWSLLSGIAETLGIEFV